MTRRTTTAGESRHRPSVFVRPAVPTRGLAAHVPLAAALVAAVLVMAGCAPAGPDPSGALATSTAPATQSGPASPPAPASGPTATASPVEAAPTGGGNPAAAPTVPVHPATAQAARPDPAPTWLAIDGTAINMPVVPRGVSAAGAMEIPDAFDRAAWYRFGPAPGAAQGSAVIAGHIDTRSDRAPFSALKSLPAGTLIHVERDGAPPLAYRVVSVELMAKDRFDGAALFRRAGPHELKVVTCGGRWLDERTDYSDNVIVTAVPG